MTGWSTCLQQSGRSLLFLPTQLQCMGTCWGARLQLPCQLQLLTSVLRQHTSTNTQRMHTLSSSCQCSNSNLASSTQVPCHTRPFSSSNSTQHEGMHAHSGVSSSSSSSSHSSSMAMSSAAGQAPITAAAASPVTQQSSSRPVRPHNSLDRKEAAKFAALADKWWDTSTGPFAALHALNTARCSFLRAGLCSLRSLPQTHAEPLQGLRVLDVGCGGGILSESVARMGAQVQGIDVSDEGVAAAAAHAAGDPLTAERIRYEKTTLEQLVASGGAQFDVVMASEVIEHVRHPQQFMADLAAATQPGGQVFITTLNRTPASYAMAVLLAERVVGLVPAGTHDWTKFITPQELAIMAADAGLKVELLAGMSLDFATGQFSTSQDLSINYAALLSKPPAVE